MGASASLARPPQLSRETIAALETLPKSAKAELSESWASIHAAAPIAQPAAAAGSLGAGGASGAESAGAAESSPPAVDDAAPMPPPVSATATDDEKFAGSGSGGREESACEGGRKIGREIAHD